MLFKANRDLARLYSLRKLESEAQKYQKICESLFDEVYGKSVVNVKRGKLSLINSIWVSKFNLDASTDELYHAKEIFTETIGSEDNYFGANCDLEIGNNLLK